MIESIQDLQKLVIANTGNYRKYGNVRFVEKDGLILFNYLPEAHFEGTWNYFEQISRGLILNQTTGEVVARPFDKIWNWGERGRYGKGHIITVTEKADGSLGILFRHKGKYRIATRGSFDSEQAHWATEFFNRNYPNFPVDDKWTLMFEIIYPENRIVIKYEEEKLVLLACRHKEQGYYVPYRDLKIIAKHHGLDIINAVEFDSIEDIVSAQSKIDATQEGWVVELSDGSRWKFKGGDYVELHKLISGLSFKKAALAVKNGNVDQVLEAVPDEFLDDFKLWVTSVEEDVAGINHAVEVAYDTAPKTTRKEFAIYVNETHRQLAPYLFRRYDDSSYTDVLFKREFSV
jgi:RNA ligase